MATRFATAMLALAAISCQLTGPTVSRPQPGVTPGAGATPAGDATHTASSAPTVGATPKAGPTPTAEVPPTANPTPAASGPPAPATSETPTANTTASATVSFAPATSWPGVSVQPRRVLFLPLANRTGYRIHPRWIRAIDETLAAHAAAFLGLEVVSPAAAAALAAELGWDPGFVRESAWAPGRDALALAARRTGAGIVVYGEIASGREVAIRAHRAHPDSSGAPWDGLPAALEGPPDLAFYGAPERLLRAVELRTAAKRAPTQSEPSREALAALASALSAVDEGSSASLRRAELALAELAMRHPRWSKPWVWLALVRLARPLAHHGWRRSDLFAEGPAAARHIAQRLSLDAQDLARLDLVDRYFLDSVLSWEDIERATAALPGDWSRALAATAEPTRDRGSFGLDRVVARGRFTRRLLAFARVRPVARGQVAQALLADLDLDEHFGDAVLLRFLFDDAHERNEWREEYGWAITSAPAHAIELAETLRLACEALGPERAVACQAPIRNWLAARGVDLP